MVFDRHKENVLFCKRTKNPYIGLYNFVGGKVEPGEASMSAAYRELEEETGISGGDIRLFRLMDFTYYAQDFVLEIYVGQLKEELKLREEANPLVWMPLTENFVDTDRFAGGLPMLKDSANIAHIIATALDYLLEEMMCRQNMITPSVISIGIDGCKGGWIAAVIRGGEPKLHRFDTLGEIAGAFPLEYCLIDMVIGLQGNENQVRPDKAAREILKGRASTVFPAPCRKAVYGETKEERLKSNEEVLHKKFTSQTDAIIPKMREVDEFLQQNPEYKNRLQESHPEVCFARLNGGVLTTSKHDAEGIRERASVIAGYLPDVTEEWVQDAAKRMKCNADDITDSICLAVTANLLAQDKTETIPENPTTDDTGLLMQMVIPKEGIR